MGSISYNFGVSAVSRLVLGGISLVVTGFLTRSLGPVGYGQYSLIFAYLFIFTTLADFGLHTILVREISKDEANEKNIIGNVFGLRLFGLGVLLLIGIMVGKLLPYGNDIKIGIAIASIFAIFSSLNQVLTGIFQKHLKLYWVSIADVLARLFQLFLIWLVIGGNPGMLVFVWIVVASETAHFLIIFLFSRKIVRFRPVFNRDYWLKTIQNALPVAISLVFVLLYFKMDTVILSLMKPARDVGVYSAAYKILEVVIFFPAAYVGLIMPALSKNSSDKNLFQKTLRNTFDVLAVFALPAAAFLFFRAENIINIIGGRGFIESAGVLRVLSLAIMMIFFGSLAGNALVALDLQKRGMKIYFLGAILNVFANLILIPKYSFYATAWTTVGTEVFITLGVLLMIKKRANVSVDLRVFSRSFLAVILTIGILYPLHLGFFVATLACLIYFPILYFLGGLDISGFKNIATKFGFGSSTSASDL